MVWCIRTPVKEDKVQVDCSLRSLYTARLQALSSAVYSTSMLKCALCCPWVCTYCGDRACTNANLREHGQAGKIKYNKLNLTMFVPHISLILLLWQKLSYSVHWHGMAWRCMAWHAETLCVIEEFEGKGWKWNGRWVEREGGMAFRKPCCILLPSLFPSFLPRILFIWIMYVC